MQNLQASQVQLAEEVSKLHAVVSELQSAFRLPPTVASSRDVDQQATAKAVKQSVRRVVQTELSDKERRSKNVIVSGLAPSDIVADEDLFLGLCETYLRQSH